MDKKSILFVCLGNICRSPAAEGIFKSMIQKAGAQDRFFIDSAGTYGGHSGELPDKRMRQAAQKRGYDLDSRSRKFLVSDFDLFDMIIAMDDDNYENISRLKRSNEDLNKLYRMTDFCTIHNNRFIPDPYYEGADGFELVLDILEDACAELCNINNP